MALIMPNPKKPTIWEWVSYLNEKLSWLGQETVIIGHSVWVQTVLRWANTLQTSIKFKALINVAWWFTLQWLSDLEYAVAKERLDVDMIDRTKAVSHFWRIISLFSDNDQRVPVSDSLLFHEKLWSEIIIESQMGHIYWRDPEKSYPRLLDLVHEVFVENIQTHNTNVNSDPIIHVLDRDWSELWSFPASKHESILDTAEKHGIDIGYSCRSGACFACACHVKQWFPQVDIGKFGYPLVDVDEWDCLTCISWLMDEAWGMQWNEIIIQKF